MFRPCQEVSYGELHPCEIHDVNYVNKCKSDVAAKLTGRLG